MALTCPVELDIAALRREIGALYTRVATTPDGEFHFHRGPGYAVRMLGYDPHALAQLPPEVTARFAGVGNPHAIASLPRGASVVDIGCGAGTDLLLAALQVGSTGKAIGVDMTQPLRACAAAGAAACGLDHVDIREGDATALPVEDESADVVMSNGVLNLVPTKALAIAEIARVLKPRGRLQIADIVIDQQLSEAVVRDIDLWTG
ncbi:MAG TPA: methyltransferase domain-containing protein [Vicinamibacterales bacterium]|nr:methyltransferase domain-containing protein [Vicinamibacterales bacterium]